MWMVVIAPLAPREIGGQMGKTTSTGFVLEQPIKVFENKAKAEVLPHGNE
jgi:hypothetical protein